MSQVNPPISSPDISAYVQHTALLLGLSIPPEQMASVVENFKQVQAIAQPVLEFPLPDDLEAAPRFEP
ncbi:hypothetical protein N836_11390 [Leptolyngbya sp. Heron Island J]|uniref:DUF4089 domain-containing protein n=1 Tax=Leptolyngbya sp. Heron Island J TaxID=1385935 RepID=UPI0003B9A49E|nr:DUF4089 domain-containing protein [Leptolyngbya sp. Heron Island J]ESA35595.1 hypothetical protein N836_11390 [Leptolyngbya sp. Heron Island J]